jgi:hypothetical protein
MQAENGAIPGEDGDQDIAEGDEGDTFDAVEWSRENGDFPGLEEDAGDGSGEYVVNWNPDSEDTPETFIEVTDDELFSSPRENTVVHAPDPVVTEPAVQEVRYEQVRTTVYWIQVASFPSSFKAEMLSQTLYNKGIPATIQTEEVNGTTWYRIRVGAFSSREEASAFQQRIQNLNEIEESFIVQSSMMREVPVN